MRLVLLIVAMVTLPFLAPAQEVDSARITDERGTIAATIDGKEWHGLTATSRFWPEYQAWLAGPNTPTPYSPPAAPSKSEKVDSRLVGDDVLDALIDVLADELGVSRGQILRGLKQKVRGPP